MTTSGPLTGSPVLPAAPRRGLAARLRGLPRRHWPFLLLFVLGAVLRIIAQFTYEPAILFVDSYLYLDSVEAPKANSQRPIGYPILFLRPLLYFHNLAVIPLVQHLLGLGMAVAIYAVLVHRGVRLWLSALAAAPVLLDAYQLQIEQNVMSDPFFQALLVGALVLLVWRVRPSPAVVVVAGLLVGLAGTVRLSGQPLLIVPLVYVLLVSSGWRRRIVGAGLFLIAAAIPLLVYSTWTYTHGAPFRPGSARSAGQFLYVRTAPLANCEALAADNAPAYILDMCPDAPRGLRTTDASYYLHHWRNGPSWTADYPPGVRKYEAEREFGRRVVANQPLDVAGAVLGDFLKGFAWKRTLGQADWPLDNYWFQTELKVYHKYKPWEAVEEYGGPQPSVDRAWASFLQGYQSVVYTRGPIFAAGALLPLLALAVWRRAPGSGLLMPALLVGGTAVALLLVSALYSFSWRYQLPAIPLLPWSAALGLAAIFPRLRARNFHFSGRTAE